MGINRCELCGALCCVSERDQLLPRGAHVRFPWLADTFMSRWGALELEMCPTCHRMLDHYCLPNSGAFRSGDALVTFAGRIVERMEQIRRAIDEVQKGNIKSVAELEGIRVERFFCPMPECHERALLGMGCGFPIRLLESSAP